MNGCREHHRVQDWLDGELDPGTRSAFEAHLEGCERCAAEVRAFRLVFASLAEERRTVVDPGPSLTERILDRVLPSRLRARFVTAVGWGYGLASAVSTFAFVSWVMQPSTPLWLTQRFGEASVRVAQTASFSFQTLTRTALQILDGVALVQILASRAAPIGRALARPLWDPMVAACTVAALLACAGVLWWMRPRRRSEGIEHVGLLGF